MRLLYYYPTLLLQLGLILLLLLCAPSSSSSSSSSSPYAGSALLSGRDTLDRCVPPPPDFTLERTRTVFKKPQADILIAVDTSASMQDESERTARELNKLGEYLELQDLDYRLVLIGQCRHIASPYPAQGRLCASDWLCIKPPLAHSDCARTGPRFLHVEHEIRENCLKKLLQRSIYDEYSEFLRPGAAKTIICITDDQNYLQLPAGGGSWSGFAFQRSFLDPPEVCRANTQCQRESCDVNTCAPKWDDMLHLLETQAGKTPTTALFAPTDSLPKGYNFVAISGHECDIGQESSKGKGNSWGLVSLTQFTGGRMYKICVEDWTPMFKDIATVVTESVEESCVTDVPYDEDDGGVIRLPGDLDPDTPFDMKFTSNNKTGAGGVSTIIIARSSAGSLSEEGSVCPATNTTDVDLVYKVDNVDEPRKVTLCSSACDIVKKATGDIDHATGNLSFVFKPVAKLKSLTVSGRGKQGEALFGPPLQIRPALTFPVDHPALPARRAQCGGTGPSRKPTVPERGEGLFAPGGACPEVSGVDLFYAQSETILVPNPNFDAAVPQNERGHPGHMPSLSFTRSLMFASNCTDVWVHEPNPNYNASISKATLPLSERQPEERAPLLSSMRSTCANNAHTSGLAMYFFVNVAGETYFGLQIGHADDNFAASSTTVDVMLSGEAKPSAAGRQPTWVLKDGLFTDDAVGNFHNPSAESGRGRVRLQNAQGGTAGAVLGPLPAYNFCVDVNLIEVSRWITRATIVDFVPNLFANSTSPTRKPCTPSVRSWGKDILRDNRGFRFCADNCAGNATEHVMNSVKCYTDSRGSLHCPDSVKFDLGNSSTDKRKSKCYPNCKSGNGKSDSNSDQSNLGLGGADGGEEAGGGGEDGGGGRSSSDGEVGGSIGSGLLAGIILGALAIVGCVVFIVFFAVRKRRRERERDAINKTVGMGGDVEMSKTLGRKSSRQMNWVPPPAPPPGDPTKMKGLTQRKRKKAGHTSHASSISAGFELFQRQRRASTFDQFLRKRGIVPSGRFDGGHYQGGGKKKGASSAPTLPAGSDWEVHKSAEHNTDYYYNKKTGETVWSCPPELVGVMDAQDEAWNENPRVVNPVASIGAAAERGAPAASEKTPGQGTYKMVNGGDGYPYYCNTVSGEVSWTLPEGCTLVGEDAEGTVHASVANPLAGSAKHSGPTFTAHAGDDGYEYYCNSATGEVVWTLPEGGMVIR